MKLILSEIGSNVVPVFIWGNAMTDETKVRKAAKDRSPNFPFISLEQALVRAAQFYGQEKRGSAPVAAVAAHWNYSPSSSGLLQTIAALKSYGLMEDDGSGETRKVRLTDLAFRILLDQRPDSVEREQFKRQAALRPNIAAEIKEKWPTGLPSGPTLSHFLVLERGFNQQTALRVSKILEENESFTKSSLSDTLSMLNLTIKDSVGQTIMKENPSIPETGQGHAFRQDVFSLNEGQVVLRWPEKMSPDSFEDFKSWIELQLRKIGRSIDA